ncbi:spindle pole body component 110-like [Centruroides sculpturatus]|uniref:spindle pole body component 110-like n=1 Tax=Centruroides sculpturatus TaxID=218467 RepID=UPI000C6D36BB|nr:spindle pole body component 110-like [Centruroides sculpturatus]
MLIGLSFHRFQGFFGFYRRKITTAKRVLYTVEADMTSKRRNSLDKLQDFTVFLLKNRDLLMFKVTSLWIWFQQLIVFLRNLSKPSSWKELWNKLLMMMCAIKTRFTVDAKEKRRLLEWVSSKISHGKKPTDFTDSWKDGIILCALIEGIIEGSCPRYDLLHEDQAASNLSLALHLIENNIGIKPSMSVDDFLNCDFTTERKLICLVSQLKLASAKLRLKSVIQRPVIKLNAVTVIGPKQDCVAKGMGLMLAVKGRKARFSIFLKTGCTMNIVIEIRGPNNTLCSERITNRSPKRRVPMEQNEEETKRKIPFEYIIQPKKIVVSYTPLVKGEHKLSIIWQGQHIMGSPYTISVDDAKNIGSLTPRKNLVRPLHRAETEDDLLTRRCKCKNKKEMYSNVNLGSVRKRRILRHFVMIDGKEIVIEDSSPEKLTKTIRNFTFGKENSNDNSSNRKTVKNLNDDVNIQTDINFDFKYKFDGDPQASITDNSNFIKMQSGSTPIEFGSKLLNNTHRSTRIDLDCRTEEREHLNENVKDTLKPPICDTSIIESQIQNDNFFVDSEKTSDENSNLQSNTNIFQSNLQCFADESDDIIDTSKQKDSDNFNHSEFEQNNETKQKILSSPLNLAKFDSLEIFNCDIKSLIALKKQRDLENLKVEEKMDIAINRKPSEESNLIDRKPSEKSNLIDRKSSEESNLIDRKPPEESNLIDRKLSEKSTSIDWKPSEESNLIDRKPSEESNLIDRKSPEESNLIDRKPSEESNLIDRKPSEESNLIDLSSPIFSQSNKSVSKNPEMLVNEIQNDSFVVRKRNKETVLKDCSFTQHSKRFGQHFECLDINVNDVSFPSENINEIKNYKIFKHQPITFEVFSTSFEEHEMKNDDDFNDLTELKPRDRNYAKSDQNLLENETKDTSTIKECLENIPVTETIRIGETKEKLSKKESFDSTENISVVENIKNDSEEEELQFKDLVQTKKQYWEKKLEVKEKFPVKLPRRTEGNRINRLKCFWQNISDS